MKTNLLSLSLVSASLLATSLITAQDRFAYAVTDNNKEGVNWSYLRKLDLQSGAFSDVLLNGADMNPLAYDAITKKQMTAPVKDERFGQLANAAFGTGVAAIAYDKKNNRLYYTPMFIDQLRYIDLKTMKVFFVNGNDFTGMKIKAADQSNIITRMVIAADGNGYALTNDANHLIKFTTGKQIKVTNLGAVVDDPSNNTVSIHNSCSSFGGDMIADDKGNLLVFSARNHVFRISTESKVATHLGVVTGLPATFTINGSAVDDANQVLISSATDNTALYTLDTKTWAATPAKQGPWRIADLANSNILGTGPKMATAKVISGPETVSNGAVQLYPNPVANKQFNLQVNLPEGRYAVQVTDALGRQTDQSTLTIKVKGQVENMQLGAATKPGVYQVRLIDENKKEVYVKKILVQ